MKNIIIKIFKWIGVTIIVPCIVALLVAYIQKINIFSAIKVVIDFILGIVYSILIYKVPIYILIITFIIIYIIVKIMNKIFNKSKEYEPEWKKYVEDDYKGLHYKWDYERDGNVYSVVNLHPICECSCELEGIPGSYYNGTYYSNGYLVCPMCEKGYKNNFYENRNAMQKRVEFNVKRMMREEKNKNINK